VIAVLGEWGDKNEEHLRTVILNRLENGAEK
jgi:hypothetical protein